LLLALAKPFRRDVYRAELLPDVCLLIAANDEAAVIGAKIQNSLDLDYPADKLKVLIASDGSVDGTNSIVASCSDPRVQLLAFPERRGKISSINDAIEHIDAEIVVFSDANTFLEKDAIRQLVANFADPAVGAVSGDVALTGPRALLAGSEDLYYWYERALQRLESRLGSMIGVDGALYAIRRRLFVAPPADTILDDMAIPLGIIRAGYRVILEPRALAREAGSETAVEEFARKARVIAGAVQFLLRHDGSVPTTNVQILISLISHKALRWLSPWFGALAFLASLRLAFYSPVFAALASMHVLILVLGLFGCSPVIRRWAPVALAHYFCLVQTAAIFGFVRGLAGRQATTWRRFARVPVRLVS
jgi:cellulose synthase/poly-beta-1,6-N-acetylglucosamine synthase-like glycosyltransferase